MLGDEFISSRVPIAARVHCYELSKLLVISNNYCL
jgi:hypothetical protein